MGGVTNWFQNHLCGKARSTPSCRIWDNGNQWKPFRNEATVASPAYDKKGIVTTACTAVAATALGCSASDDAKATWTWTQDDDLPVLCMQVSGGAIVAMPGCGWKPQDGWIQVQLSGGSIPGKEIKSIIQEGSTLVVQLKKPASDIETMDLRLTEYRVEGGDVSSIESVDIIDKGERHEAQLGVDG